MKRKYMNLACAKLIQEMDYLPATDEEGTIIQRENIITLQNYTGSELL